MSFEFGAKGKPPSNATLRIEDLLRACEQGGLQRPAQPGRRSRRRAACKRLKQSGVIAPLLAAQGCLTLGQDDIPLESEIPEAEDGGDPGDSEGAGDAGGGDDSGGSGGGSTKSESGQGAQDDSGFEVDAGDILEISVAELLANDVAANGGGMQIVKVYGAVNGTAALEGGFVIFTPDEGFEGVATFKYEAIDGEGNLSEAVVEIQVGESDDHDHDDDQDQGGDHHHDDDGHGTGDEDHPHPDDPDKAAEHMALLALVPVEEATHVAVKDGSWFDPATWANGEVPSESAKVLIPDGLSVQYDGESAVSLFTVRVDGVLEFATDADTFMEVDTLIVTPSGHMTIGTIDNPVAANVETVIQIADNGPIDAAWDPMLLSRGVVSHGAIDVHGAEKDPFLQVAVDAMAGDTSITLEAAPEGWRVGDKLVLTGTHLTAVPAAAPGETQQVSTEDEELTITSIDGNVVHFDTALKFDHEAPRADLKAYVANYTRNIRFETENSDNMPVHQRGHVMFMHSDNIDVRYAEFFELGRTDKSERAFDVDDLASVESDSNLKGRYSLHIHRAGVTDQADPAMVVGNAVWGSPGWGFVHHDSNAILTDNAAYNVFGAAFVAETGNEIGRWTHNIAIKSIGVGGGPKWHEDVSAFDLGRSGAGFWFQGRLVDAVDNVAASVPGGHGFVYMSRGNPGDVIDVLPGNAPQPESLLYLDSALINKPAISQFDDNVALVVGTGLEVIKGGPEQGHDVRSVIEGFTAWEVRTGVHLQYTAHYTLKDIDLVGTDQSAGGGTPDKAVEYGPNTIDVVINNANLEGFETGVLMRKTIINLDDFDNKFDYVFIDVGFKNIVQNFDNGDSGDLILTGDDLVDGRLEFDSDLDGFPQAPKNNNEPWLELSGLKTDSIGATEVSRDWDQHLYNWYSLRGSVEQEGYWTLPDGRHIAVFQQYVADRATGFLDKIPIFVENLDTGNLNASGGFTRVTPVYHGILDLDNDAPVAATDIVTVGENDSIDIDVLANDFDPEGDSLSVDGFIHADHGSVYDNGDGTVTYVPDPNYVGDDMFYYWVEDDHGNLTMGQVQVTVEI